MARLLRTSQSSLTRALLGPQALRNLLLGKTSSQFCHYSAKAGGKKKAKSDSSDEELLSKKDLALQQAIDQITTSFGKGSIMWLGRSSSSKSVPVISTGSFALDIALGIGGVPKGRVVEIYGPEASGKTTLALHIIAEAQKQGGYCAFIDAEHALDPTLAEAIGVNTKNLLLSQPDCGEQALSLVDTIIRSGSVDVVVVDSVAALVPKSELDGEMGDAHMAMQARLMSQALRKLCHSLSQSQTVLVFINQVRAKLSTFGYGGPTEVTCGGNALKFYASMRLNIRRVGSVKRGEETIGSVVSVKIVKNKHAPPFRSAQFELEFGKGISRQSELVDLGIKYGYVSKGGGGYYRYKERAYRGKDAMSKFLMENSAEQEELELILREKLLGHKPEEKESDTEANDVEVISTDTTEEEEAAALEA
ncbi:unnamed protein product [Rhodiola kirilowii]